MYGLLNLFLTVYTALEPVQPLTRFQQEDADSIAIGASFATVAARLGLPGDYRTQFTTYPELISAIALLSASHVWYGDHGMIRIWFDSNGRVSSIRYIPSDWR